MNLEQEELYPPMTEKEKELREDEDKRMKAVVSPIMAKYQQAAQERAEQRQRENELYHQSKNFVDGHEKPFRIPPRVWCLKSRLELVDVFFRQWLELKENYTEGVFDPIFNLNPTCSCVGSEKCQVDDMVAHAQDLVKLCFEWKKYKFGQKFQNDDSSPFALRFFFQEYHGVYEMIHDAIGYVDIGRRRYLFQSLSGMIVPPVKSETLHSTGYEMGDLVMPHIMYMSLAAAPRDIILSHKEIYKNLADFTRWPTEIHDLVYNYIIICELPLLVRLVRHLENCCDDFKTRVSSHLIDFLALANAKQTKKRKRISVMTKKDDDEDDRKRFIKHLKPPSN